MKLYLTLHETSELQTELTQEECEARLLDAIGLHFTGEKNDEGFHLNHIDKNPFRPEIYVRVLPAEEDPGTLVTAEMKLHPAMFWFLLIWTLFVIGMAAWRGWLLLVMVPVFLAVGVIAFSIGVKHAKESLIEVLDAIEIIG